jgi:hypothetical protein
VPPKTQTNNSRKMTGMPTSVTVIDGYRRMWTRLRRSIVVESRTAYASVLIVRLSLRNRVGGRG